MNTNTTPLGSQSVPADPIPLRSLALDHFLAGRYPAAEVVYRDLLERRFQEASTCGHLARVLLMQDRVGDARSALARAWKYLRQEEEREETLPYTRPRLLFLRMLCAMLAGRGYDRLVARLERELEAQPAQEPWSIEPVLEHVKASLAPAERERLNVIAEAINDAARRHYGGGAAGKTGGSTLRFGFPAYFSREIQAMRNSTLFLAFSSSVGSSAKIFSSYNATLATCALQCASSGWRCSSFWGGWFSLIRLPSFPGLSRFDYSRQSPLAALNGWPTTHHQAPRVL